MRLNASDNYLAVFKGAVDLDTTSSGNEDATGLTGWSIKDKFAANDGATWQDPAASEAIRITVNGYETPANQDASGQPEIRASAEGAPYLFAETVGIRDANGLPHKTAGVADAAIGTGASGRVEFVYSYQWIRVDGMTETNIGTDSDVYHLVDADYGKLIKVDVSFTDRHGYAETVTSEPFRPVRGAADPLLIPINAGRQHRPVEHGRRDHHQAVRRRDSRWGFTARATSCRASRSSWPPSRPL